MGFIGAISGLAITNVISQVAQVLVQPYLARIYPSEQFGVLGQFVFISTTFSIFGSLQIHHYLVVKKDNETLQEVLSAGLLISSFFSLFIFPLLYSFTIFFYEKIDQDLISLLTCWTIMLTCYGNYLRGIQISQGKFRNLMMLVSMRTILLTTSQILFGIYGYKDGLIYGIIYSETVSQLIVGYNHGKLINNIKVNAAFMNLKKLFAAQKGFLLFGSVQELVAVIVYMMPVYLISRLYGNYNGGQFAMAFKLSWAPILLLTQSMSPVLLKYISDSKSKNLDKNPYLDMRLFFVILIGFSGFLSLAIYPVFIYILGSNWVPAASIGRIITVHAVSFLAAFPFRVCYKVFNGQRKQLCIDSIALALIVCVFFQYKHLELMMIVQMIAIVGVLQNLLITVVAKKYFFVHKEVHEVG